MLLEKIAKEKLTINIHHVGGIGGYGPAEALNKLRDVKWFVYDADKDSLKASNNLNASNFKLINRCIGLNNKTINFYVTAALSASSIFESSPNASNYVFTNNAGSYINWKDNTQAVKTFKVRTRSLDSLLSQKIIPGVDFISIDAQGSEKNILEGANKSLATTVLGVVTETDFSELYKRQPLFYDIHKFLHKHDFYLSQIFNNQFWNVSPVKVETKGRGFLAVSESLFLRDFERFLNKKITNTKSTELIEEKIIQSLKLAAICVVFDQLDFALQILSFLRKNHLVNLKKLAKTSGVFYIKMLNDLDTEAIIIENDDIKYKKLIPFDGDNTNYYSFITTSDKALILLKYLSLSIKSLIYSKKQYFTNMSNVYSKYALDDLARLHDERVFRYYIFCPVSPYPKNFIDRLLKLFFRFKYTGLFRMVRTNNFNGSYKDLEKTY